MTVAIYPRLLALGRNANEQAARILYRALIGHRFGLQRSYLVILRQGRALN